MTDELLKLLKSYPLKSHENEHALQADLVQYLNSKCSRKGWNCGRGVRQISRVFNTRGTPDIVLDMDDCAIAIEAKYIKAGKNGERKGGGGAIWSGIGQTFANRISYDTAILFIQTDVGETEQGAAKGRKGSINNHMAIFSCSLASNGTSRSF